MKQLLLLGLPPIGVATAFGEFQHAVRTSLVPAAGRLQLDLLAQMMPVVVLGVVTLVAYGLISVFLIKRAAVIEAR